MTTIQAESECVCACERQGGRYSKL